MDPLTLAGSFATIVGLLCNYKGERRNKEDAQLSDFLLWLENSHHNEIKDLIAGNTNICSGIENILKQNHNDLIKTMTEIDNALASFASKVESFSALALAVKPDAELSKQAMEVLEQLISSNCSGFIEIKTNQATILQLLEGGQINYIEPIFIEDDLSVLNELGLLRVNYNKSGSRVFKITRSAVSVVNATKTASNE